MDAAGWIDISIIASFNRIKNLTTDQSIVRDTMCFTPLLEVIGDYVRLRQNWPEWILPNASTSRVSDQAVAEANQQAAGAARVSQAQEQERAQAREQEREHASSEDDDEGEGTSATTVSTGSQTGEDAHVNEQKSAVVDGQGGLFPCRLSRPLKAYSSCTWLISQKRWKRSRLRLLLLRSPHERRRHTPPPTVRRLSTDEAAPSHPCSVHLLATPKTLHLARPRIDSNPTRLGPSCCASPLHSALFFSVLCFSLSPALPPRIPNTKYLATQACNLKVISEFFPFSRNGFRCECHGAVAAALIGQHSAHCGGREGLTQLGPAAVRAARPNAQCRTRK
jgi:hypothetical protein